MTKYDVAFEYNVPEWATVENIEADDEQEAATLAQEEFARLYPEAVDPVMIDVIHHVSNPVHD